MNTHSYFADNDDTSCITLSTLLAFTLSLVVGTKSLFAQPAMDLAERNETSEQLFVRRIVPLLREKCFACHGDDVDSREGGLDLRSLQTVARGGDSEEPGVVPMHPDRSSVYLAVTRNHDAFSAMPPKEIGLPAVLNGHRKKIRLKFVPNTKLNGHKKMEFVSERREDSRIVGRIETMILKVFGRISHFRKLLFLIPMRVRSMAFFRRHFRRVFKLHCLLLVVILSVGQPLISPVCRRHQMK